MKKINKAEGTGLSPALRWFLSILFLVLWSAGVGLVGLYYAARVDGYELFYSYLRSPLLILLNCLPGLILALLLFGVTNRVWAGVLGGGAVVIIGALADFFKLQTRSEPLLATDLKYITEAADISSRYTLTISPTMILCFVAIAAATVFALFLLKARFSGAAGRCIFLAAVLAAGAGLYFGVYRSERVYSATENLDVRLADGRKLNEWNEADQFCCRGFWYPFIYSTTDLGPHKPDGYSAERAETLLAAYADEALPTEQKVSVISIMLEAYADFSGYEGLEFAADPYRFFHELQAESVSGELDTNIFAGGTIDTERCYMAASTEMYEYRREAASYVRWFSEQGYETEFLHPGYSWFYNRKNVSEYLGFDRCWFGDEGDLLYAGKDTIMLDSKFFPILVDRFHEMTADGSPCFQMSVTYQNHGPYADGYLYDTKHEFVRQNGLSDESYNILNNYFWGIERTDCALETLVDTLRTDPEPVVLVLFGDHKPWLGDNSSAYADAGIDLSRKTEESFYDYCRTPYVIWANDAAKETLGRSFTGEGGDFSPCYLMMKLFDECGFTGDAYMNALRDTYAAADLISPRLSRYRVRGEMTVHPERLPEADQKTINDLLILSYYRANHAMR